MALHSSTSKMSRSSSSNLSTLSTLVQHMLGPNVSSDEVNDQLSKAQLTLQGSGGLGEYSSRLYSTREEEERSVVERITKHLMRQGREKEAIKFQELHNRLKESPLVKNRSAILQFLLHLGIDDEERAAPLFKRRGSGSTTTPLSSKTRIQLNGSAKATTTSASSSTFLSSLEKVDDDKQRSNAVHVRVDNGIFVPESKPKASKTIKKGTESSQVDKASNGIQGSQKVLKSSVTKASEPTAREPINRELLREIVFIFQGIEGRVLRRDSSSNPFVKILNRERLSISEQQLISRLCELGFLYTSINDFCRSNDVVKRDGGMVLSSFVQALRNELGEFYLLLSALESATQVSNDVKKHSSISSLHHLAVWTHKPRHRLQLLLSLVEGCKKERGGKLISTMHAFLHHGDLRCVDIVRTMLCTVCKPMYTMLLRWLCDGRIEDAHNEFFIASDDRVAPQSLWHDRYSIRHEMIPNFLDIKTVNKIFATGKNINFLQEVCRDSTPIQGRDTVRSCLEKTSVEHFFSEEDSSSNLLHQSINRAFKDTSAHVLGVLFTKYKLLEHLTALRKYLLLGQGDIIRYLLELLEDELSQPATTLQPHNLAGILETAIRATNAQYEDPDILGRLDVRLLETQPGDCGWDVFSLDYKVDGPIGTVFKASTMTEYLMLFNAFWRAKHVEYLLSDVWKRQASLFKMSKLLHELRPLLHMANLLTSEMVHFIHQLAYYIMFEVMECSWDLLLNKLKEAESLDELIEAHQEFLFTLHKRSLLNEDSKEMLTQLRAIYDRIIEFKGIQHQLFAVASSEAEARVADRVRLRRRDGRDHRSDEIERSRKREREFVRDKLPTLKSQLKIVSQSYQDMVRTFLLQLASSEDEALQFLSFRLDFNQHYKRRDARLGTPFTYKHRSRMQASNRLVQSSSGRI